MRQRSLRMTPLIAVLILGMIVSDRSGVCALTVTAALLHEMGHLVAAGMLRIPLGQLRLNLLGARLEVRGRMLTYGEEWILCAFGPLFSLLGAAVGGLFWQTWERARIFSCASLLLGLLNLLPIRSFDGGRMLDCTLSVVLSPTLAYRILRVASFLFLCLLWMCAAYFLLRTGEGISLFCFSMSLFSSIFSDSEEI
ncbi:MAG: hypothetical protein IIW36_01810 [Clostridia bacterium]|nr:hypothetical protein [Clostridia bacterium]